MGSLIFLTSCTVGKVCILKENGFFSHSSTVKTIKKYEFFLDSSKATIVVPYIEFTRGMTVNLRYFDLIITYEEFEIQIIKANKQDEVGTHAGKNGLIKAFRKFNPLVYLLYDRKKIFAIKINTFENF